MHSVKTYFIHRSDQMCKKLPQTEPYPFLWLDELIEISLNPVITPVLELTDDQLQQIAIQSQVQIHQIAIQLKRRTFLLLGSKKLDRAVAQFQAALDYLLVSARANLSGYPANSQLRRTGEIIIRELEAFRDELTRRYQLPQPPAVGISREPVLPDALTKILCRLSVDQIGIILKAADDVKLIVARSLSYVFKAIVPYLSTEKKKNISWDSMRSSTYHPEESDKAVAIAILEKMIRKIREY